VTHRLEGRLDRLEQSFNPQKLFVFWSEAEIEAATKSGKISENDTVILIDWGPAKRPYPAEMPPSPPRKTAEAPAPAAAKPPAASVVPLDLGSVPPALVALRAKRDVEEVARPRPAPDVRLPLANPASIIPQRPPRPQVRPAAGQVLSILPPGYMRRVRGES
jgi:hypothetical protein